MEKFRRKVSNRVKIGIVYVILVVSFVLINNFSPYRITGRGFSGGFVDGFVFGLAVLGIVFTLKIVKALKDEESLRALYIEENDERTIQLENKVGTIAYKVILITLSLSMMGAVYTNKTVFITLLAVVLFISFLGVGLHLYYNRSIKESDIS